MLGGLGDAIDTTMLIGSVRNWLLNVCDISKSINEIRVDIYNRI